MVYANTKVDTRMTMGDMCFCFSYLPSEGRLGFFFAPWEAKVDWWLSASSSLKILMVIEHDIVR